jgi:hypothetical protein
MMEEDVFYVLLVDGQPTMVQRPFLNVQSAVKVDGARKKDNRKTVQKCAFLEHTLAMTKVTKQSTTRIPVKRAKLASTTLLREVDPVKTVAEGNSTR